MCRRRGLQREPFNFTPMAVNSISSGSPHVRPMGRTCGEPDEIKKNTHPKDVTALVREQADQTPAFDEDVLMIEGTVKLLIGNGAEAGKSITVVAGQGAFFASPCEMRWGRPLGRARGACVAYSVRGSRVASPPCGEALVARSACEGR